MTFLTARRIRRAVYVIFVICVVVALWRWFSFAPALKDGDLIFQTSRSQQSAAIGVATLSLYTHMGIIKHTADGIVVIEAAGPVRETPLKTWIKRGRFHRYAVYRAPKLKPAQLAQVYSAAKRLYGRPYDPYFSFDNQGIYCSELVDRTFSSAGIRLGQRQKIEELAMLTGPAAGLLKTRAAADPECRALELDADPCLGLIRDRQLITPVSIARDRKLRQIYSNYPF